jgi:tRNA (guanine37-N1)-methyltransferase
VSVVRINVVTIFPETMDVVFATGMLAVAAKKGIVEFRTRSPRDFTSDAHRSVDDSPFGGGAGMIIMAPPIVDAVESFKNAPGAIPGAPVLLMSPAGRRFDQAAAQRLSEEQELTFICGRYKGVDERVKELVVTEEISLGDFVLSGGEFAAAAVIEAVVRLKAEVLGNEESANSDAFAPGREYRGLRVPDVLMSGHHAEIEKWRRKSSLERTRRHRPDLLDQEKRS